ncbi:MAG: hypothetical protein HN411_00765 [Waddliaceae bacterium]|jgi:hypothetical protein|nr:hypothetical protein [Waddliaceae bacterium]MBT3579528.1 hypothetical protein [Waddliaceae bacterium]MBT4444554.1 hypothetical protein [Waddliaceae bacterium]MBT6928641.1 hypothetical protein [Waddliaceae bacterium]MBT7265179.1 hypothetical protein [Waddliaceae bacterium]
MLSFIGLGFIIVAWLVQYTQPVIKEIKKPFIACYAIGLVFLIIDGFIGGLTMVSIMNIIVLAIASGVFYKSSKA